MHSNLQSNQSNLNLIKYFLDTFESFFIMQNLTKLIKGNKFTEFSSFIQAFDELRCSGLNIIDANISAFSDLYEAFVNHQPDDFNLILKSIITESSSIQSSYRHMFLNVSKFPDDAVYLKELNEDYQKKAANVKALEKAAAKERENAIKAEESLEKANRNGDELVIEKLEQKCKEARKKAEYETDRAERENLVFAEEEVSYRKKFTEKLMNMIIEMIDMKLQECSEIKSAANNIIELSSQFVEYDDDALPRLDNLLEELEKMNVE